MLLHASNQLYMDQRLLHNQDPPAGRPSLGHGWGEGALTVCEFMQGQSKGQVCAALLVFLAKSNQSGIKRPPNYIHRLTQLPSLGYTNVSDAVPVSSCFSGSAHQHVWLC